MDRKDTEVPSGMQRWGAIREQQHTSEGAGRTFRRIFRRKKQGRKSGGLDWREEDVLGASLNRNPGNYQVQFFSLPFAISCLTQAAVKGAREVLCTQRPSLPPAQVGCFRASFLTALPLKCSTHASFQCAQD